MRIVSWNVNGFRSVMKKDFGKWLKKTSPDIVGLQEVRAHESQIAQELASLVGYQSHIVAAERKGYSGVGLLSKEPPLEIVTSIGKPEFDIEGRVQIARFRTCVVVNTYIPQGAGKNRDNSRIPYKLAFTKRLFDVVESWRSKKLPILVMGDLNVAHREIDIARPKANVGTAGFTKIEREDFDQVLSRGYTDTFRTFEKGPDHYSWWSNRPGVREKNVGWRIDYVLADERAKKQVQAAFIEKSVMGSDHAPVGIEFAV